MAAAFDKNIGFLDVTDANAAHSITVPAGGVAAGALVACLLGFPKSMTVTVTDTQANTWTQMLQRDDPTNDWRFVIVMSILTTALAAGNSITYTTSAGGTLQRIMGAMSFTATAGFRALSQAVVSSHAAVSANGFSGFLPSGQPDAVFVSGVSFWNGVATTAGAGWTEVTAWADNFLAGQYRVETAEGTFNGDWTHLSDNWEAGIVRVQEATAERVSPAAYMPVRMAVAARA